MHDVKVKSMRTPGAVLGLCVLFMLSLVGQSVWAQDKSEEKMKKAMNYFNAAQYDNAIQLLSELAMDKAMDKKEKREVLLALGRTYFAKNLKDRAKETISNLLDLEPPIVTLDPDAECPPLMRMYYEVRKTKTGSSAVERPDPGMKTIAILDFKNRSIDDHDKFDPMEKGFAELMISQLNGGINLKVIERERIQWIMDEIGLENTPDKFDENSAVRVGKQLGVHTVLLGSFIKTKNEIWLSARMVKVETSEILATESVKGDADEFFELAEKLSVKVAKSIKATISEADVKKGTETKSLDAMMLYSEGLVALEKGNYKSAYDKFLDALAKDPSYEKARTKAESLKPLLG
jgi:TolB-like protein